ncbi:precorrin-6A synthase (deacetylating) [Inquilinus limosus]|uniref:Precorrin-6A synthase [deacetylating] n=1 Tax=Inquilinus limosus TaxID=171674 RepID=A0A211ZH59_9PROT|nr:precorrin-6A synthase (deacetylating) [Inquilinus limosus]OWJ64573.1 precorrin-6A synthase (deacetylating) [Inquilinus limosus]
MRTILVIGIGAGNPDYMTVQAIKALNRADVFFIPDKGTEKAALRELREEICGRFIEKPGYRTVGFRVPDRDGGGPNYRGGVEEWRGKLADAYEALFREHLSEDGCGAFLVWGDPALYDSTLRILETIRERGFAFDTEVIPGISAVQALAAQHRIPLNRIGEPILVTTGRRIAGGLPEGLDNVVVMLDGETAFRKLEGADIDVYWGAYLGTPEEILVSGRLPEVTDEIDRVRRAAREQHGWIMDTYLLRRTRED